jgi:hypothetical protein
LKSINAPETYKIIRRIKVSTGSALHMVSVFYNQRGAINQPSRDQCFRAGGEREEVKSDEKELVE